MKQKKRTSREELDAYLKRLSESTGLVATTEMYDQLLLVLEAANSGEFDSQTLLKNIFPAFIRNNIQGDLLERYREIKRLGKGVSLRKLILVHGDVEGNRKWDDYRRKQAETNTFDYKNKKYGMTREEFDTYNRSRSSTKQNFIDRHGDDAGSRLWDEYCRRQAYAGVTIEYFMEKYGDVVGVEVYNDMIARKSNSIDGFILRYGESEGLARFEDYINKVSTQITVSRSSQRLFQMVCDLLSDDMLDSIYYKDKNQEFGKLDHERRRYYFYDFVCSRTNIVVEYNGDLYHANPSIYSADAVPPYRGNARTAKEIWQYDKEKNDYITNLGFDVIIVWESEFLKDEQYYARSIADRIKSKLRINV